MKFEVDKQTISNLELFGRGIGDMSVFSIFNLTRSAGETEKMKRIFCSPLTGISLLENRMETLSYFETKPDFRIRTGRTVKMLAGS
jgi:DNA mismatch repair protein MutS